MTNSYVDATITAQYKSSIREPFGTYGTLENCYYNSDNLSSSKTVTGVTAKTTDEINSSDLATALGSAFVFENGIVKLNGMDILEIPVDPTKKSTTVTATTTIPEPTYTVIIPATIDFGNVEGCLEKYRDATTDKAGEKVVVSKSFDITASGVNYLFHDDADYEPTITLSVDYYAYMQGTADYTKLLPYTISNGSTALAEGVTKVGTFKNDVDLLAGEENKITLTASLNRADIKVSDTYKGLVVFNIARTEKAGA